MNIEEMAKELIELQYAECAIDKWRFFHRKDSQ
jgi:hypothetical protein